jgi:hypothetical protein
MTPVMKANQVKRPRDSHDNLDLATDVRLLCNDVAWAKGAPVDDVEAVAGCEHNAFCAAHTTVVVACAPRRRVGHGRAHARHLFSLTCNTLGVKHALALQIMRMSIILHSLSHVI